MQQRKAAIADRLRQAGVPIQHSGVSHGGAQREAAGSAPGDGNSTQLASHPQQHVLQGDGAHGSSGEADAAAGSSDAASAGAGHAAAAAAPGGEVRIEVEHGFRQWMREVSGERGEATLGVFWM